MFCQALISPTVGHRYASGISYGLPEAVVHPRYWCGLQVWLEEECSFGHVSSWKHAWGLLPVSGMHAWTRR